MTVASFLAGAILSWALPLALLVAIGVYWAIAARGRAER